MTQVYFDASAPPTTHKGAVPSKPMPLLSMPQNRVATVARACPRCGASTARARLPFLLRPLRLLVASLSLRRCHGCNWRGLAR